MKSMYRAMPAVLCLAATVLLATPTSLRAQNRAAMDVDKWITALDRAQDAEVPEMAANVAILPAVDAENRVLPGGQGIQFVADELMRYGPQRRMAGSAVHLYLLNHAGQYGEPGRRVADGDLATFAASCDASVCALPRLKTTDAGWTLTVELKRFGDNPAAKSFEHKGTADQVGLIPAHIARDALAFVEAEPTAEQAKQLDRPQARSMDDYVKFGKALSEQDDGPRYWQMRGLTKSNPDCMAMWAWFAYRNPQQYINVSGAWKQADAKYRSELVSLGFAEAAITAGRPPVAMQMLVDIAATHRGDGYYNYLLIKAAMNMEEERLVNHVTDLWKRNDDSYLGNLYRGHSILEFAWNTSTGREHFEVRLREALRYLDAAIERNPRDFMARGAAIIICRGLALDRATADGYFKPAARANPLCIRTREHMIDYLRPGWRGSREEMLQFAFDCIDRELWDSKVPILLTHALSDVVGRDEWTARRFAQEDAWKHLEAFDAWLTHVGTEPNLKSKFPDVCLFLSVWAEQWDRAVVWARRAKDRSLGGGKLSSRTDRYFFQDVAFAHAGDAKEKPPARVRRALDEGDWQKAQKMLDDGAVADAREAARLKHAVALCRRLGEKGELSPSANEIAEAFSVVNATVQVRDDGMLAITVRPGQAGYVTGPFGFGAADISGEFAWTGRQAPIFAIGVHLRSLRERRQIYWLGDAHRRDAIFVREFSSMVNGHRAPAFAGPKQAFVIRVRDDGDTFVANGQTLLNMETENPVPGTIELFVQNNQAAPVAVLIRDLKIKLAD